MARFQKPGYRATGDRTENARNRGVGYEYLHWWSTTTRASPWSSCARARTPRQRPACSSEGSPSTASWAWEAPEAVLTDNAFVYVHGRAFKAVLESIGARHIRTPAYPPRWNGKVERFIQTLLRESAYVRTWDSSHARARALLSFVRFDNRRRPHGSLGGGPPLSRVDNVCGS